MDNQQGVTIAADLAPVIQEVEVRGFKILSIVTDNASNEIARIRELRGFPFQRQSRAHIFRVRCLSHAATLAIRDFLKKFFPDRDLFKDINLSCGRLLRDAPCERSPSFVPLGG
jgi:hypothetical protein